MLKVNIEKQMSDFRLKVCFSCENANLLALTGSSGAGKTTLIRILAGLEKADKGQISLNGKVWFDSKSNVFLSPQEREVGYVFQEHTLFPHMSIAKNVSFIAQDKERATDLLHLFHISHIADRRPHQVSGGERQRAAFAQALARKPKVLLLDEPFSALDSATRAKLQKELAILKKSLALPIVHVTHDLEEAKLLADTALHVDRTFSEHSACWPSNPTNVTPPSVLQPLAETCKLLKELFCLPLKRETTEVQR